MCRKGLQVPTSMQQKDMCEDTFQFQWWWKSMAAFSNDNVVYPLGLANI
jgi:hypothetical protein